LPAATEIVGALGLMDQLVGVAHECDYPAEANRRPRVLNLEPKNFGDVLRNILGWCALRSSRNLSAARPLQRGRLYHGRMCARHA
jgi:hypothetical protein